MSITVSRMALVRVLRLNVIWMVYLAKPVKNATGDASREKKVRLLPAGNGWL